MYQLFTCWRSLRTATRRTYGCGGRGKQRVGMGPVQVVSQVGQKGQSMEVD